MNDLKNAIKDAEIGEPQSTEAGWTGRVFRFEPAFVGFSGHFPGYPLVPAFVQVLTSIVVMEKDKKTDLEIAALDKAKFQRELWPGTPVTVECRETAPLPLLTFQVRISDEKGAAASFLVKCVAAEQEKR